jgi:hypothetical protein
MCPIFASVFLAIGHASSKISYRLFPVAFAKLDNEARNLWNTSVVGVVSSCAYTGLLALGLKEGAFDQIMGSGEGNAVCNCILSLCVGYCVWALSNR